MSNQKTKLGWLTLLLVPFLGACAADTIQLADNAQATGGLTRDTSVDIGFPNNAIDPVRVRYYNTVSADAAWVHSKGTVFSYARGIGISPEAETLYIADRYGVHAVSTKTGAVSAFATDGANTVSSPHSVDVDSNGNVYIVSRSQSAVVVYGADNKFQRVIGAGELNGPRAVAIDNNLSRIYVAETGGNEVSAWTFEGEFLFNFSTDTASPTTSPLDVAVNSKGLVYVLNWGDDKVQVFTNEGTYVRAFGENGVWPGQFVSPKGIAFDMDDNLYVTDVAFGNIQIFTPKDELALYFGTSGGKLGELSVPAQLAIDSQNRIFVPELGTHRVQIFEYLSL